MKYRYEIPSDTNYRNHTIRGTVEDLDPDGFVAEEEIGDVIVNDILDEVEGIVSAEQWDDLGPDGAKRLLYWDSELAAEDDDGARATEQITKTPVT